MKQQRLLRVMLQVQVVQLRSKELVLIFDNRVINVLLERGSLITDP
jgi:hypothetical protein